MVDELLRVGSIKDPRIEAAFRSIPRQLFLPGVEPAIVYRDDAISIQHGEDGLPTSSSSQPTMMATMLEQLSLAGGASVLEIGTGSGYNAALLGVIVGDGGRVRTLDIDEDLVAAAQQHLRAAGVSNIHATVADGWSGFPADAPYDRVEVTVGVWDLSPAWIGQLAPGGIIVAPLWLRGGVQASIAFRRDGADLVSVSVSPCGFIRMRGPHAGPEVFMPVGDWVLCDDGTDESEREQILRLLRSPAIVSGAPGFPDGWFIRVALSHPRPVRMWTRQEPWLDRRGILLPDGTGLAVSEDGRILTFGNTQARDDLLDVAFASSKLEDVTVIASPTNTRSAETGTSLVRPAFTYSFVWAH
ncbi:MAG: protein-L-isoaspartate(D-aspartate) O-methyltransferase [Actinomycetota bacterium]|jgi:protein-L-isoaspartate(D-aspartate) O-methyltransferase|nr:protein-L-isoaspartate(D-aspartate) O-methyltransferase [Actinomycetota bacterium]